MKQSLALLFYSLSLFDKDFLDFIGGENVWYFFSVDGKYYSYATRTGLSVFQIKSGKIFETIVLLLPGHFLTALFQLTLIGSDVTISRLGDDKKGWPAINVVVESWPTAYFYMCGWSWKNPTRRLVVGQRSFLINICFSFFYLFRRTSWPVCVCLVWEGNDGPMSLDFRVAVKSFSKKRKKNWFECWHHSPLPGLRLLDTLFNLADVYAVLRSLLVSTFEPVKAISIWPLLYQSKQSRKRKPPLGLWHKGTGYCPIPQRCHLGWKDDTAIFVDQTTISRVEREK